MAHLIARGSDAAPNAAFKWSRRAGTIPDPPRSARVDRRRRRVPAVPGHGAGRGGAATGPDHRRGARTAVGPPGGGARRHAPQRWLLLLLSLSLSLPLPLPLPLGDDTPTAMSPALLTENCRRLGGQVEPFKEASAAAAAGALRNHFVPSAGPDREVCPTHPRLPVAPRVGSRPRSSSAPQQTTHVGLRGGVLYVFGGNRRRCWRW